jgi:hypothetical protein
LDPQSVALLRGEHSGEKLGARFFHPDRH